MEYLVIAGLGLWLWLVGRGANERARQLQRKLDAFCADQRSVADRLSALEARVARAAAPAPPSPATETETPLATTAVTAQPSAAAREVSTPDAPPVSPLPYPAVAPASTPSTPMAPPPAAAQVAPGSDATAPTTAPWAAATQYQPPAPVPARPAFDLAAFLRKLAFLRKFDWEQLVGVKLFSLVSAVAVLFAAGLFVVYSIDHGWVTPPIRMAMSTAFGLALVVASEMPFTQRYRLTTQPLAAAGIAVLFFSVFAAHALWHLIDPVPTFAFLALVAAVAVLLAVRRSALVVAILGLLGGFAAPYIVSTGQNRPFGLFGYLLLLNVGLAWVAHKKRWPLLSALSLLFTAVYQAGWAAKFLDGGQLPLALGIFLVFPVVGFAGIALGSRRDATAPAPSPLARWTAVAGALPPAALALYLAGSGEFAAHWPLVLAFLLVVAAGLTAVAAWQGPEWLHLAGAGAVLVTLAAFLSSSFTGAQWPALAGFLALFAALYLGTPFLLARLGRAFRTEGELGVLAAPLVLAAFVVTAPPVEGASPLGFLLPLLLLTAACSGVAVLRGEGRLHLLAAAVALAAEASWSAYHLNAGTLYPALLAYAAFAALFLGTPLLAERRGRPLSGAGAGPLLLACLALLAFVAHTPAAGAALGSLAGLTVLAALFQAALFAEAARGRSPLLALAGVVVGFLVLGLWALTALAAALLPGLLAAAALGGVALAGTLLVGNRRPEVGATEPYRLAPYLGLGGHLFVIAVAAQDELALPATPWLAVLGLLDLGFLAAALLRRRGDLLLGASAASVLALLLHEVGLGIEPPAPAVAGGAALALAALFLAGFLAARRVGAAPARGLGVAGAAALVALHGAQGVLLLGARGSEFLPLSFLVPAHLALGVGLLALAWLAPAEGVALGAAVVGALAAPLAWPRPFFDTGPTAALWLATPAWLLALAYPLVRGARSRGERLPFLAAVVASAAYLLVARKALVSLGAGPYLGALPVVQAGLLVPHIVLLLRMEPPSARDMGRLALMAAAVLALVTVAIPLQLDKQWWTIGWALLAAALAWLWRRIPHRGLLVWSAGLLAASFVRLLPVANPWVLEYHARGQTPIFNWYLYAYAMVAGAHFLASWMLAGTDDRLRPGWPRLSALAAAGGAVLLFLLVNIEIADYWSAGARITFRFSAGLGPDLSYTIAWALFAVALLLAGVLLGSRGTRVAAILLLVATVLKAFLHDLSRLPGLYRIGSFLGLAASLAVVALLLQRFVLRGRVAAPPPPAPAARSQPEVP